MSLDAGITLLTDIKGTGTIQIPILKIVFGKPLIISMRSFFFLETSINAIPIFSTTSDVQNTYATTT